MEHSPKEVAEAFRTTRQSVYNYIKWGKLEAFKVDGKWRIPFSSIEKLLKNSSNIAEESDGEEYE